MRRLIVCWKQECEKSWWISRKWWSARYCCDVQNVETKLGDGWAKSKLNCGVSWFISKRILHYLFFLRIVVMFRASRWLRRLILCWKQECKKSWWIFWKWWSARYCCDVQNVETKWGDGWAKSKLNCGVSWFILKQILHDLLFLHF